MAGIATFDTTGRPRNVSYYYCDTIGTILGATCCESSVSSLTNFFLVSTKCNQLQT